MISITLSTKIFFYLAQTDTPASLSLSLSIYIYIYIFIYIGNVCGVGNELGEPMLKHALEKSDFTSTSRNGQTLRQTRLFNLVQANALSEENLEI